MITRKQREALWRLFDRSYDRSYETPKQIMRHYRKFRRTALREFGGDAIMVPLWGMWLGIEKDGYTHS